MSYTLKAMSIAALCTAALAAQTVSASAMGSGRDPDHTNLIVHNTPQQLYPTQKNAVIRFDWVINYNDYIVNQTFADQR